ncbi:MAG: lysylphosphatidylglycerol synthase domain-containing protein [Desulfosarcinaceae bacterium]|nr:lysylphosphatidylglycerol synthase domain-containing protein [Desulfosarcinaceae bacterium]
MPVGGLDKQAMRRILGIVALVATLGAAVYFVRTNPQLLTALLSIPLSQALALVLMRVILLALNGLFLKAFSTKFDVHLRWDEWLGLACVTAMWNLITPLSGGLLARAAYLKSQHNLSYSRFAALLTANYFILFWTIGLAGLLFTLPLLQHNRYAWLFLAIFASVVILCSIFFIMPVSRLKSDIRLFRGLNSAMEGWQLIKKDKRLIAKLFIYTLLTLIVNGAIFWTAYNALGISVPLHAAILVSLLSLFAILIYITPGSLGFQEAIVSFSSELLGAGVAEGLLVSLIIRAALAISAFSLGPLFGVLLMRRINARSI